MGISQIPSNNNTEWVEIATSTPTNLVNTFTFSSIPAYKNLAIRYDQISVSTGASNCHMQFNSDTGNNYAWSFFGSNSSYTPPAVQPVGSSRDTKIALGYLYPSTSGYSSGYILIEGANQPWKKIMYRNFNADASSPFYNNFSGEGRWNNASAITSITISVATVNFSGTGTWRLLGSF